MQNGNAPLVILSIEINFHILCFCYKQCLIIFIKYVLFCPQIYEILNIIIFKKNVENTLCPQKKIIIH